MRKTKVKETDGRTLCVSREELPGILGCGQSTADRIAREAGARIKVGKRVLVKLDKLSKYLDLLTE